MTLQIGKGLYKNSIDQDNTHPSKQKHSWRFGFTCPISLEAFEVLIKFITFGIKAADLHGSNSSHGNGHMEQSKKEKQRKEKGLPAAVERATWSEGYFKWEFQVKKRIIHCREWKPIRTSIAKAW